MFPEKYSGPSGGNPISLGIMKNLSGRATETVSAESSPEKFLDLYHRESYQMIRPRSQNTDEHEMLFLIDLFCSITTQTPTCVDLPDSVQKDLHKK